MEAVRARTRVEKLISTKWVWIGTAFNMALPVPQVTLHVFHQKDYFASGKKKLKIKIECGRWYGVGGFSSIMCFYAQLIVCRGVFCRLWSGLFRLLHLICGLCTRCVSIYVSGIFIRFIENASVVAHRWWLIEAFPPMVTKGFAHASGDLNHHVQKTNGFNIFQ